MRRLASLLVACAAFGVFVPNAAAVVTTFTDEPWPAPMPSLALSAFGDVDNDGDEDLVVSRSNIEFSYYRNDGWPSFGQVWTQPLLYNTTAIDLADVDGDLDLDFMVTGGTAGDQTQVWHFDPMTDSFSQQAVFGNNALGGQFADVDVDGDPDIIYVSNITRVFEIWRNPGTGVGFADMTGPWVPVQPVGSPWDAKVRVDIGGAFVGLFASDEGTDFHREAAGPPFSFTVPTGSPAVGFSNGYGNKDFDGDGITDVVTAEATEVALWLGLAPGTPGLGTRLTIYTPATGFAKDIAVADFDNDGDFDVAVGCTNHVMVLDNDGTGTFVQAPGFPMVASSGYYVSTSDVDNDGDADLVYSGNPELRVLRNDFITLPPPEICNGIDDDLNGIIDDGAAHGDCAPDFCHFGTCFPFCATTMDCAGVDVCYLDDGRCDDAVDPCTNIMCQAGEICYSGSCFPQCTSHAMCDPTDELCYQSNSCRNDLDPCLDVQCPFDEICYEGGCFLGCGTDLDCSVLSPGHRCYDGRCAVAPCDDVDCPIDQNCYGGGCFDSCVVDAHCGPDDCYNGRCAPDACDDVDCSEFEVCYAGSCYPTCATNGECGPDDCYAGTCRTDPCDDVQCATAEVCYGGSCFTSCTMDAECDPMSICYNNRCAELPDPWCDDVLCPVGDDCYRGTCYDACLDDTNCAGDETCYQGTCLKEDCSTTTCDPGEICLMGVGACFEGCAVDTDCTDYPTDRCFDGRCAPTACEALDQVAVDAGDANHVFRAIGKYIEANQESTPWYWPTPVDGGGVDLDTYANVVAGVSSAPVFQAQTARIVMYLDKTQADGSNPEGKYALWLVHGAAAGQAPAQATYSVRFRYTNDDPSVVHMDDPGAEHADLEKDNGWEYFTTTVTTTANETGSVALGWLRSTDDYWEVQIFAEFAGDITTWELYDADSGVGYPLRTSEYVFLRNRDLPGGIKFHERSGSPCDRPNDDGICDVGTYTECVNGQWMCDQTVFPWIFEICDGVDNTCNGDVDSADPTLRFPQMQRREIGQGGGWKIWPSHDTAARVGDYVNYTPRGADDLQGSTDIPRADGTPLQEHDKIFATPHRADGTNDYSAILVTGAYNTNNGTATSFGDHDREVDVEASWTGSHTVEEFFIGWYDDRGSGDDVLEDLDLDDDEWNWKHKTEQIGSNPTATLESDATAVRLVWLEGSTNKTSRFYFRNDKPDEDDEDYEWYAAVPRGADDKISLEDQLEVQVEGRLPGNTVCIAGAANAGCWLGRYQCVGGQTVCSAADSTICGGTCSDGDGDGEAGYDPVLCPTGLDCNDSDPNIGIGEPERCNGIDDNCDGLVDLTDDPMGMNGYCPNSRDSCGPQECGYATSCICPDGPEDPANPPAVPCTCGEGLGN